MSIFTYLLENKILDKKEFLDVYSVRGIKVNDKPLNNPQMDIKDVKSLYIGFKKII